jgi:hypothetical protein
MFKRFRATLRHYALIITKFNHTCMVCIADCTQKYNTPYMHVDVLTPAHFVLEFVLNVLYTFTCKYQYQLVLCFQFYVRLRSFINFGSRIELIYVINYKWWTLHHCTLCFYNTAIRDLDFHRFIVIHRLTIENSLIWQPIFIIFITRKFPPDIRFHIR